MSTLATAAVDSTVLPLPEVDDVEHIFLELEGTRFHIATAGGGDPLVLLHGWPQHWWCWRHLIPELAQRYRLICPDIRGLGWSDGAYGSYRWDDLARDLFGLLDRLGYERVRLVGHDWGVPIGYRACLMRPKRIERFVPIALAHPWQPWSVPRAALRRRGPWHVPAIAVIGGAAITRLNLAEHTLHALRHAGSFSADEAAIYLGPARRPGSVQAAVRWNRAAAGRDAFQSLLHYRHWYLSVPTLHLYGEYDPLTPYLSDGYRPYAPEMSIGVIPESGHWVQEEAPAALIEHLDAFL